MKSEAVNDSPWRADSELHRERTMNRGKQNHVLPSNDIFGFLFDQVDALQHVGDVVDASLLHLQHFGGGIAVEQAVRRLCNTPTIQE